MIGLAEYTVHFSAYRSQLVYVHCIEFRFSHAHGIMTGFGGRNMTRRVLPCEQTPLGSMFAGHVSELSSSIAADEELVPRY